MRALRPEDVLVVKSIDRLGRNYAEILEQWTAITKEREAAIVVLDMPLLDTRQGRDLTSTLIADIVLQLLSYVAQTERENIRQRQAEGIAAAKDKGVRFGPPPRALPENFDTVRRAWRDGKITLRAAAELCNIPKSTFRDAAVRAETALTCKKFWTEWYTTLSIFFVLLNFLFCSICRQYSGIIKTFAEKFFGRYCIQYRPNLRYSGLTESV